MTVYLVVERGDWQRKIEHLYEVYAAFSSREKARTFIALSDGNADLEIIEIVLD